MQVKKNKQDRDRAIGHLMIMETRDGELSVAVEVEENETIPESSLNRIRKALSGLAFSFEHDPEHYDSIGAAYLTGMTDAFSIAQMREKEKAKKIEKDKPNMGFHGTLKNE